MPVEFEVTANNCGIVSQVLDAGIAAYVADRAIKPDFQYSCMESVEPSLTAWQIWIAIYVAALIPAMIGWAVLYFKGEPPDKFFVWGFLSFMAPVVGPFLALVPVDEGAGFISRLLPAVGNSSRRGD